MASVNISESQAKAQASIWMRLMPSMAFALPFLALGCVAESRLFISNEHARLLSNALIVADRGRAELIGYVYPPLPFLFLLPWPDSIALLIISALSAGTLAKVLWRHLRTLDVPNHARIALLVASMAVPTSLYLATQSVIETLALLMLVVSWDNYLAFVRQGDTKAGFTAGFALGAALFICQYTLIYAVIFVILTPRLISYRGSEISVALVLLFPVVVSIVAWSYISWSFTGDPVYFLRAPGSSLFVYVRPDEVELSFGWNLALRSTVRDLLMSPLYLGIGMVVAVLWPIRIAVFVAPVILITIVRAFGLVYPDYFAVGTYTVTALIALKPSTPRKIWPFLVAVATIHLYVGYSAPLYGEMREWAQAISRGETSAISYEEQSVGEQLAKMPARSVLSNDQLAYRIIARARTVTPFLLPIDGLYKLAESQPSLFVSYVLAPTNPVPNIGDRVTSSYPTKSPPDFYLDSSWSEWQLYRAAVRRESESLTIAKPASNGQLSLHLALQKLAMLLTWFICS